MINYYILKEINIINNNTDEMKTKYIDDQMKNQVRAYYEEVKWLQLVTSGYPLLAATSLIGMGDVVTKETFDWMFGEPKIVIRASAIFLQGSWMIWFPTRYIYIYIYIFNVYMVYVV